MNYGEIRTQFKAILNRRDCSNSLADTFLNQSLQRCTRELRTPSQEAEYTMTVTDPFNGLPVPNDIIQVIAILATTSGGQQRKLTPMTLSRFLELDNDFTGQPQFYCRIGNFFQFRPTPAEDTELVLYYYGEFEAFTDDNDTTILGTIAPDLLIYGALSYAADYFMDDRGQAFEARYNQIAQALQDQAYDLQAHDASIAPTYNTEY